MLYWKSLHVESTKHALAELEELNWDEEDLGQILHEGMESRQRKEGVHEFELKKGGRIRKIVIAESFQYSTKEMIWAVIHVGEYSLR
ncbi:MAG: hypothetical protein AABX01_02245 [Candidatus Micrarchaeota archaeon]